MLWESVALCAPSMIRWLFGRRPEKGASGAIESAPGLPGIGDRSPDPSHDPLEPASGWESRAYEYASGLGADGPGVRPACGDPAPGAPAHGPPASGSGPAAASPPPRG